jgi:rhodanese-related sulfurtransferase
MSVFRSIEHGIQSVLEGAFGRAFRSHVQPVELARKLAKEMDEHRTVSVSRVYVPNEYQLWLSPSDHERFQSYEDSLLTELSDYLSEHARREGYALLSTPRVTLHEDEDLSVGEFGIATRTVQPRPSQPPAPAQAPPAPAAPPVVPAEGVGETKIFKAAPPDTAAVSAEEAERLGLAHAPPAAVLVDGRRYELTQRRHVIGRSRDCDISVDDPNVSRRHAEIRQEDGAYWVVDLNSTNGIEVNGARVDRARLENDDLIVVGRTNLTFERPE